MEYYNNILCVEGGLLYKSKDEGGYEVMTKTCYDKLIIRKRIIRLQRGGGSEMRSLIKYDSLPEKYRFAIEEIIGDPYKTTPHNSFKDKITTDARAMEYYSNYQLQDGRNLPQENILEYCANAQILNAIHQVVSSQSAKRKALGGQKSNIWDKIASIVEQLKPEYKHSLPSNPRRLHDKYKLYVKEGYQYLIHRNFCNDNSRKVTEQMERLFLSLYAQPTKPYSASVHDQYLQFLSGILDVVDIQTGEVFNRYDFYDKDGVPIIVSEQAVWNYINDPKNRVLVDKARNNSMDFNAMHRPHHHRHSPIYALSKVSMDDRDLPRKMADGNRVKAYYAYDVASTCVIGASYSRLKDKSLFIDCMRDMFRFINRNDFGMPLEVEVEHHLVNKFKDDLMNAGVVFPFVRWCNPGNSQEKRAEHFNRVKKYGFEKTNQEGIGRFYAKLEANKTASNKVFNETNDTYKEKTYSFERLVADDRKVIELYNNSLHPNQKRYPGMSRMDVLKNNQNPDLSKYNEALLTKHIGDVTETTIRRSQYVTVQYCKYQLSSPEVLDKLNPNNYKVEAYYLYDEKGCINEVFIYQNGVFIDKCAKLESYNEATAEQTEKDHDAYTDQAKYVSQFDKMAKDQKPSKVVVMPRDNSFDVEPVLVPVRSEKRQEDWELDTDDYSSKAMDY